VTVRGPSESARPVQRGKTCTRGPWEPLAQRGRCRDGRIACTAGHPSAMREIWSPAPTA